MQFLRLLHRRTKSEGDVSTLLPQPSSPAVTAPVFVPLQMSLPSFDPTRELYAVHSDLSQSTMDPNISNATISQLESQLAQVQAERSTLEQDLADYRTDLLHTRTELYSEMLCSARQQQRAMDDFRTIQKLEERHQRFCTLLVDIGIPRSTVDVICQAMLSGNGSPDDVLVDAIKDASNNGNTLLARLRPIVKEERTPEHYQSALNLTLSIRKELKSQKKRSKFWKKLAQEDDRHASTMTPSSSDISSIRQDFSPERQSALDALISRRRAAKYLENGDGDVFGGQQRESALDVLASSLVSHPRHSFHDELRLTSSFASASNASTKYLSRFSVLSRVPVDSTTETPVIQSRPPSPLFTSLRRSSRSASQSIVLGSVDLNVSRTSSIDPIPPEETDHNVNPDGVPASTATRSQDLLQNSRRTSQGHGHRRVPSITSRRPVSTHSIHTSFRLSARSPIQACRQSGTLTVPDLDISGNTTIDVPSFRTPDIMFRLSDLASTTNPSSDTPASGETTRHEQTPYNDEHVLPKYGIDTPLSPTELAPRMVSTPLDGSTTCAHTTRFLEHLDSSISLAMSVSASESGRDALGGSYRNYESDARHNREDNHARTVPDSCTDTIPAGESKDSLFTTSTSSLSAIETPAPTTPPTPSPSPVSNLCATSPTSTSPSTNKVSIARSMLPVLVKHLRRLSLSGTSPDRERLVDKLRGLRSLSRSRSRSRHRPASGACVLGSPARSDSSQSENATPSPSPVKGSGIPVLQRRMTVRARRMSVRNV